MNRRLVAAIALPLVALALTACGGSPESASAPRVSVAAESSSPVVVASETPMSKPSCWSDDQSPGAWRDQYNAIADSQEAVKVLDALPPAADGCTQADQTHLANAHDLAARIHAAG